MTSIPTVILPLAGSGSRMRPATDATAKELLPVYDTPLLHFALTEAMSAGAKRLVLVTSPAKPAIAEYVGTLRSQPESPLAGIEVCVVAQDEPLGLGHAVLCAREAALPGPFGVILPDDLILGEPALAEMVAAFDPDTMKCLAAAQKVERASSRSYGMFRLADPDSPSALLSASGLLEKPDPDDAPSDLAVVGRYVLSDEIWEVLAVTPEGSGGEIQLTDAIAALGGLWAFRFSGARFDCGSKEGLFEATRAYRAQQPRRDAHAAPYG